MSRKKLAVTNPNGEGWKRDNENRPNRPTDNKKSLPMEGFWRFIVSQDFTTKSWSWMLLDEEERIVAMSPEGGTYTWLSQNEAIRECGRMNAMFKTPIMIDFKL